jgi:multidrug efflux pump
MCVGTLFTLFVVPSIYMLIARDHSKDSKHDTGITAETYISG